MSWTELPAHLRWQDVLDVAILTFVAYRVYMLLRGTVALQVLAGMGVLFIAAIAASQAGLVLTTYLLQALGAVAAIAAVVVFQGEIRRALRRADPMRWWRDRQRNGGAARSRYAMLADGLTRLANARTGALVVLPRYDAIEEHISGGTWIDAQLCPEILESLFQVTAPVHDGAAIVRHGRVERAGVFLPLTSASGVPDHFGTRHRAALGLSEACDAVVLTVSEERGEVTAAIGGNILEAPDDSEKLSAFIKELMAGEDHGAAVSRAATTADASTSRPSRSFVGRAVTLMVILAMVCGSWYILAGDRSTMISIQLPLELRNAPDGTEVELLRPRTGEIKLNVRGPRRLLYSRARDEVLAWVPLGKAERGRNRMPIKATAPAGLEIVSTEPEDAIFRLRPKRPAPEK